MKTLNTLLGMLALVFYLILVAKLLAKGQTAAAGWVTVFFALVVWPLFR